MSTWQIILAFIIVGLSILMPIYYSSEKKKKEQQEEVEKIDVKSDHEIELEKYQQQRRLEREAYIKKEREKENTIKFEIVSPIRKDPNRGMKFVSCNNEPINRGRLGHSKTFLKDVKKPKTYYW